MNIRLNNEGIALIEPMYYHYPNNDNAYEIKNEYFFWSELIVSPITAPNIKELQMGRAKT